VAEVLPGVLRVRVAEGQELAALRNLAGQAGVEAVSLNYFVYAQ
jgi:hypothetical protein